jgi:hypothetical protein
MVSWSGSTVTGLPAGTPSVYEILDVVRAALHDEVIPAIADRPQYVVRMTCRLLDIVQRELEDGRERAIEIHEQLQNVGATDESDLAAGLVAGRFDPTDESVRAAIHQMVRWRITVARPDYLGATDAGP